MNGGIYKIVNIHSNKIYIGSTVDFAKRWQGHKSDLRKRIHHSILLQRAWNKYGEKAFIFEVIEDIFDKYKLLDREQYYFDTLKPRYNVCKIAGNTIGIPISENCKRAVAKANKGNKYASGHIVSLEAGIKMSKNKKNKRLSLSNIEKIKSIYKKGNMSMRKIANLFRVSYTAIWKVINNQIPSPRLRSTP